MYKIEFLFRPQAPVAPDAIRTKLEDRDLSEMLCADDRLAIERIWEDVRKKHVVFSNPKSLATLRDTTDAFSYWTTDFKTYCATTVSATERQMSRELYDMMRIAAVGGIVKCRDGSLVVHRRNPNMAYDAGFYDMSCAGLCVIKGDLDHGRTLRERLQQELRITPEETVSVKLASVHSSRSPGFSAMFDYAIETRLGQKEIMERYNRERADDIIFVHPEDIPRFVIGQLEKKRITSDGVGALLSSLHGDAFNDLTSRLQEMGLEIMSGVLVGKTH